MRELRNQGGKVLDRVQQGEQIVITRDGEDVAELRPVRKPLSAEALYARWRNLPAMDPESLRRDIDEILDTNLWNVR
ncbi:MAG: prevent-host-death protein [Solirubrobacterales bacterium 67-14]|nr:MAG: prevent-host-death protein [Solirubrobacterales bacterium 67-14]